MTVGTSAAAPRSLRFPLATSAALWAELFHLVGDRPWEVDARSNEGPRDSPKNRGVFFHLCTASRGISHRSRGHAPSGQLWPGENDDLRPAPCVLTLTGDLHLDDLVLGPPPIGLTALLRDGFPQ